MDCTPPGGLNSLANLFYFLTCALTGWIVPLLFAIAVVGFIWGIIQYFLNPENEESRKAGKKFMIWGLVALFVMVSMWGIVKVFGNTLGVGSFIPQLSQCPPDRPNC